MTIDLPTISEAAMQLSLDERLQLAQRLWDSVPHPPRDDSTEDSVTIALRKSRELDENPELGIPHDEVMEAAHEAFK